MWPSSSGGRLWASSASLLRGVSRCRVPPRGRHPPEPWFSSPVPARRLFRLPLRGGSPVRLVVPRVRWSLFSFTSSSDGGGGGGAAAECWNCGAAAPSSEPFLACGSCGSVQPVDSSVDYFKIFGLEKRYGMENDNLESKYKDWQKKLHPDLVHTKSKREKDYAAEQSPRVIDAYRTLSKPLSRATYLLKLEGVHVDEEKTISDPELLAEVMEIRESVEEANDSQALEQIKSQIQQKLESWSSSFGEAFRNRKFEDAVISIQRMTYYERAIQEIVKKL